MLKQYLMLTIKLRYHRWILLLISTNQMFVSSCLMCWDTWDELNHSYSPAHVWASAFLKPQEHSLSPISFLSLSLRGHIFYHLRRLFSTLVHFAWSYFTCLFSKFQFLPPSLFCFLPPPPSFFFSSPTPPPISPQMISLGSFHDKLSNEAHPH